jgi:predicted chitinase
LKAVFHGQKVDTTTLKSLINLLNKYGKQFGFDNPYKIKHFLAQIAHESGGLKVLKKLEDTHYTLKNLMSKNLRYFFSTDSSMWAKGKQNPHDYVGKPEKILNLIYANSNGNKGIPGAGWLYRGRGPIQLTGRNNYIAFQNYYNQLFPNTPLDLENHPELVNSTDEIAMLSAMWWCKANLWMRFKWDASTDAKQVSSIVNTGKIDKPANGEDDRLNYLRKVNKSIDCDN